jgi:uncharacterized protein
VPPLPSFLHAHPDGCLVEVRVVPRAGRTALAGSRGDALLVRLAAAPVEGAANAALVELIAGALGVPTRRVALVAGARARTKRVVVQGMTAEAAAQALRE